MIVQERKLQTYLTHEYKCRILNYLLNESRVYKKKITYHVWYELSNENIDDLTSDHYYYISPH